MRGFTGMLPKHVRDQLMDQLQAGLEGIEPVIYAGFTLSFLLVCTLCVRLLCCAGRDGEDSMQHVGGRRADNAEAIGFKEPAIRMDGAGAKRKKEMEKRRPRTRKELKGARRGGHERASPRRPSRERGGGAVTCNKRQSPCPRVFTLPRFVGEYLRVIIFTFFHQIVTRTAQSSKICLCAHKTSKD